MSECLSVYCVISLCVYCSCSNHWKLWSRNLIKMCIHSVGFKPLSTIPQIRFTDFKRLPLALSNNLARLLKSTCTCCYQCVCLCVTSFTWWRIFRVKTDESVCGWNKEIAWASTSNTTCRRCATSLIRTRSISWNWLRSSATFLIRSLTTAKWSSSIASSTRTNFSPRRISITARYYVYFLGHVYIEPWLHVK